ncbi:unnamed protein product [Pylaiella littoralis]
MPTPDEKLKMATAITYVKTLVKETLGPRAQVHVFGSQLTGLVLPNSDIDTVVFDGPSDSMEKMGRVVYRRQNQGEVREVSVIKSAKVPLVKFVHIGSGIQVDVCFDQISGMQSGEAARAMMKQMTPVRPLVMVLKAYMGQRKLNETYHGGIGSFLLQLMVVALVQKCGREAKDKGHDPPTNLGYLLDEFFDFYGNQLNYATTGITLLSQSGGGFFNKQAIGWFEERNPFRLSMQNPHQTEVDTASNSYKADVCKESFKATSLRLRCAIQRDLRATSSGGEGAGGAETGGFLKYCVDPGGDLKDRVLPPPTFCTRFFDEEEESGGVTMKDTLRAKAQELMKKHGGDSLFSAGATIKTKTKAKTKKKKSVGRNGNEPPAPPANSSAGGRGKRSRKRKDPAGSTKVKQKSTQPPNGQGSAKRKKGKKAAAAAANAPGTTTKQPPKKKRKT